MKNVTSDTIGMATLLLFWSWRSCGCGLDVSTASTASLGRGELAEAIPVILKANNSTAGFDNMPVMADSKIPSGLVELKQVMNSFIFISGKSQKNSTQIKYPLKIKQKCYRVIIYPRAIKESIKMQTSWIRDHLNKQQSKELILYVSHYLSLNAEQHTWAAQAKPHTG